jgi:uncharacterized protein YjiS (DUF1127 family)
MGPFTALMTVDHTAVAAKTAKTGFFQTTGARMGRIVTAIRNGAQNRRLRDQLADMDHAMLKDIGIADDEIHMIRSRANFTPRAWVEQNARAGSGQRTWNL